MLGYIQTIALAMAMVAFGWLCYGSYRPTFLQECQPDMSKIESIIKSSLQKFLNIRKYFKPNQICKDPSRFTLGSPFATPSFPSGQIASVMSVWVYFLLYYAAKVNSFIQYKTWNRRRGQFFKVILFFLLFLVPVWVGVSRIVTNRHTVAQVIVGGLIGIISALLVYRYKYCSLFGIDAKTPNYYLWYRLYPQKNPQVETSLQPNTIP
ncbi:predicted protein [Naegleria gruberi]|uniref:Predicted protein n=1 Tax=Naegleria gruberi TaxID=5762 RepID=D2VHI2_NAEGR|nr:uncharacterized protein NAEGRDRAFT_68337 [Naegleria gruberi]EFC43590.1 predicted protein [Naegleria gruberi]|eukprot:XP_002676334.1 predicted protein [Naegleria gruberi strain NEG-M]